MIERTPLHDLSRDELIGLILRLQKQLADLEKRNAELAARNAELAAPNEELSRRIEELEKKNPTVRLDEAYSLRVKALRIRSGDLHHTGPPALHHWAVARQGDCRD